MKVSGVQIPLVWKDEKSNLDKICEIISSIEKDSTNLVVLPEVCLTGFCTDDQTLAIEHEDDAVKRLSELSSIKEIAIVGTFLFRENNHVFNRALWFDSGSIQHTYNKHHLFSLAKEYTLITKGYERLILTYKGWRIRMAICYELRFPEWLRNRNINGFPEYDILLVCANWPESRANAWITLLKARAIENLAYVVGINIIGQDGNGINYSGNSLIIGPDGEVLANAANIESVIYAHLDQDHLSDYRKKFPFLLDQD